MRISDWSSDVCSSDLDFTIFFEPRRSVSTLSSIPLIKPLLLGVLYSLEISIYSLIDTFTGISGNFSNSHKVIFIRMRSEEHTSELQSLMRISYAVFCLKKKNI